jgi:hypothetical protein
MELIEVDTSLYKELEKYEGGHVIFNFIPLYIMLEICCLGSDNCLEHLMDIIF